MPSLESFLAVREMLASFLQEDTGTGDITSNSVLQDVEAKAEIICKTEGATISGLEEAAMIFDICNCDCKLLAKDSSVVKKGRRVMAVSGSAKSILKAERTALNLLMRMSGIATETRALADKAKPVKISATRKTAPGLRYFDKKAVVAGGGLAHRMRLDDMVLIKDNHLDLAGTPEECVRLAKKNVGTAIKVECEARNLPEAISAINAGADIVMLDNFTPTQAAKAIKEITKMKLRKKALIEISGGVNHKNIRQYAKARPDYISMGYITHSPKAVDFSLEIVKT
ncbi:MAG: carboxylating nicotinate-nucleotide diphosphorylase [Nitrososphaera sp.]